MKKRCFVSIFGAIAAISAIIAPGAAAATEVGNGCEGNGSAEGFTLVSAANAPGSPLPAVIPSAGVITRWTFNVAPIPSNILTQALKIVRPTGAANQFQVVGESGQTFVSAGLNTFPTRIPVQAGDHLALTGAIPSEGKTLVIYCHTGNPGDRVAILTGSPGMGSTATSLGEEPQLEIPVTATVEPDVDGDGYGDETQDKCPQSATTQAPCPVVTLSTVGAVKKTLASISVTSSSQASVTVAGAVRLGKGKTATLNGGTQIVAPGTLAKFVLLFPQKLQAALKALPRKRFLTLTVTASAPNVVGAPSTSTLKLHLKGQAKPKKQSRKKSK